MDLAYGSQDWYYNEGGEILHFPACNYFYKGERKSNSPGEEVTKYQKPRTTYLNGPLTNDFDLQNVVEPQTPEHMRAIEEMKDEMCRPMVLIMAARKK